MECEIGAHLSLNPHHRSSVVTV